MYTIGMSLMWRRSIGSLTRGIGARGQPRTPSKSLKSCFLGWIAPSNGLEKLAPGEFFVALNHSRMTSQELSFLLPSSCISGSGHSIRGVNGWGTYHTCCFLLILEPISWNYKWWIRGTVIEEDDGNGWTRRRRRSSI